MTQTSAIIYVLGALTVIWVLVLFRLQKYRVDAAYLPWRSTIEELFQSPRELLSSRRYVAAGRRLLWLTRLVAALLWLCVATIALRALT